MYLLLIRLRVKKLTKHGDQQISQIHLLLDSRGTEMEAGDRSRIQEMLLHAGDLRAGLDTPRLAQLKQARLFRDCAEDTLRILKEEMLPPHPQIETGRLRRRRINS